MLTRQDTVAAFNDVVSRKREQTLPPEELAPGACRSYAAFVNNVMPDSATTGDAFDTMCSDMKTYLSQITWVACCVLDQLDPTLRGMVLQALADFDPPSASIVYVRCPSLTDAEDKILYASFSATMPTIRDQLASGAVVRAKGVG